MVTVMSLVSRPGGQSRRLDLDEPRDAAVRIPALRAVEQTTAIVLNSGVRLELHLDGFSV